MTPTMADERINGPTPAGGDYAIASFFRDGVDVPKEEATEIEITEYSADGRVLKRTYGNRTGGSPDPAR